MAVLNKRDIASKLTDSATRLKTVRVAAETEREINRLGEPEPAPRNPAATLGGAELKGKP